MQKVVKKENFWYDNVMEKCIYCDSTKIKRHGYHKKPTGKLQRYKCKECNRTFCEGSNGIGYDRTTNKVLKLLYAMLDENFFNKKDLIEAVRKAYNEKLENVEIIKKKIKINYNNPSNKEFECFTPKVLISTYNDNIILYPLSKFSASKIKLE